MKILITTYGGGHVNIVIPVAKQLLIEGEEVIILAMPAAIEKLQENKLKYKTLNDYKDKITGLEKILSFGECLASENHNKSAAFSYYESVLYYGVGYYNLVLDFGEQKAKEEFNLKGRKAFIPLHTMCEIMEYERPDIVYTTCGQRMERAAQLAAKKLSIKCIKAMDTIYISPPQLLDTDYIFCLNDIQKKRLERVNFRSEIIVVGQPASDVILQNNAMKKDVLESIGIINSDKPVLLWATGVTKNEKENTRCILELAKKRSDLNIIIKLHPTSQDENVYRNTYNILLDNVYVVKNSPIHDLINVSDVILTQYSTVGQDAMLLNKQLIIMNIGDENYPIKYYENNCAYVVIEDEELEPIIDEVLIKKVSDEMIESRQEYMIEPYGTENTVNNIIKIGEKI